MQRKMLRSKIHRATITQCDLDYVGSLTVDATLLSTADIRPNEAISVYDIDNGARFDTYIIRGEPDTGVIGVNGAAARLVEVGHKIIIACFGYLDENDLDRHTARVILVDDQNHIIEKLRYDSAIDACTQQAL